MRKNKKKLCSSYWVCSGNILVFPQHDFKKVPKHLHFFSSTRRAGLSTSRIRTLKQGREIKQEKSSKPFQCHSEPSIVMTKPATEKPSYIMPNEEETVWTMSMARRAWETEDLVPLNTSLEMSLLPLTLSFILS